MVNLAATSQRRRLALEEISQIMPEVRHLAPAHYTVGNWSLGQVCKHLEYSFIGSMEGFNLRNHRLKRLFMKRKILQVTLAKGIPPGYTVDPSLTPPSRLDLGTAMDALAAAVERYLGHEGPLRAHPLFGKLPRDIWDKFHCFHAAHHLSFVIPQET